tara:strand:+ start:126 stop:362 length:237 start_codon:yes stop_codon:yes gene_type:complete
MNYIDKRIKNTMAIVFEINENDIGDNSSSDDILSWDSMNHMNLVVALEEEFKCEFDEDDIENMLTFNLIKIIINEKIS